eukprot:1137899-Pelagomonas_calceolata.AAC.5
MGSEKRCRCAMRGGKGSALSGRLRDNAGSGARHLYLFSFPPVPFLASQLHLSLLPSCDSAGSGARHREATRTMLRPVDNAHWCHSTML